MRETFPTRLLLRLLQATPEELVAIERFLDGEPLPDTQPGARPGSQASRATPPERREPDEEARGITGKVFELLKALDPNNRLRKAPPIKVFNLYFGHGLQPAEIAEVCKCDRSTVFRRLKAIRAKLPWSPRQLHEMSSQFEAMEDALTEPKARGIHRQSAVYGDEHRERESD